MKWWRQIQSNERSTDAPKRHGVIRSEDLGHLTAHIGLHDIMRIQGFVDECPDEISGLAEIKALQLGGFSVMQPFILPQTVTGASTDLTEAAAGFLFELVSKNESPEPYKFWWHSHVDMSVFWSGTDEGTARQFNNVFMVSMVLNRRREFALRLDMFEPFRLTIYDLPLQIDLPSDKEVREFCRTEIEEKIGRPLFRAAQSAGSMIDRAVGVLRGKSGGARRGRRIFISTAEEDPSAAVVTDPLAATFSPPVDINIESDPVSNDNAATGKDEEQTDEPRL